MTGELILALISLGAATVTGALGYGYSSLSVPIALLFVTARILNPALVLVEVASNLYALVVWREAVPRVLPRVLPMVVGIVPGAIVGSLLLSRLDPSVGKAITYGVLLPFILVQAAGLRWPLRREGAIAVPFGGGIGLLYSLTTVSGPPLALFFNNQGFTKSDFKVALAITRSAESTVTLVAYAWLGFYTPASVELMLWLVPGVLVGIPLGHRLIHRVDPELFRRICMSFDAWVVAFGLSRLLAVWAGIQARIAYLPMVATVVLDAWLLWRFLAERAQRRATPPVSSDEWPTIPAIAPPPTATGDP
jgi:uncharacterized membrane protein YfcA